MEFVIKQGDISLEEADALVNAAGTSLVMGSGVAGALRRRGGEEINRDAVAQGPIGLGQVVVTPAYRLQAKCVIHADGHAPLWRRPGHETTASGRLP